MDLKIKLTQEGNSTAGSVAIVKRVNVVLRALELDGYIDGWTWGDER